jgi:hypothetical protein
LPGYPFPQLPGKTYLCSYVEKIEVSMPSTIAVEIDFPARECFKETVSLLPEEPDHKGGPFVLRMGLNLSTLPIRKREPYTDLSKP